MVDQRLDAEIEGHQCFLPNRRSPGRALPRGAEVATLGRFCQIGMSCAEREVDLLQLRHAVSDPLNAPHLISGLKSGGHRDPPGRCHLANVGAQHFPKAVQREAQRREAALQEGAPRGVERGVVFLAFDRLQNAVDEDSRPSATRCTSIPDRSTRIGEALPIVAL